MALLASHRKSAGVFPRSRIAPLLLPGALWLWLFFHLHYEWALNPQYQYGWAVPFLGAFMFYQRWQDRPSRVETSASDSFMLASAILLLLLLPVRLVEEANPDWRLLSWTFALIVVAFSLLAVTQAGGRNWLRHFAFPLCFPLVAVPWLAQFENVIVQGMSRAVAYAAVEIAGWIGVGALQSGNVIELHNGFVGVNEACSGVKTLQAAIMVTLVLGELSRMTVWRRVVLLVSGCVWVFFGNVLRATSLVVIASRDGVPSLERWHDLIGTIVIVAGMAGLLGIAWLLRGSEKTISRSESAEVSLPSFSLPIAAIAWLVTIFGATELWYRSHERELIELPRWEVRQPNESSALPIPEETRAILRYNQAQTAAWRDSNGAQWWNFFARWEPQRAALQLVRSHSPDICLPAVGRKFQGELPPVTVETAALPLTFRAYRFEQNDRPLFVFVCIQEDKVAAAGSAALPNEWNTRGRLLAAWRGQRNLGQRLLEIAVFGIDEGEKAREEFARTVRELVVRADATG